MVAPAVLLLGILLAGIARGEPVCNAFTEGAAGCLGNKQCVCRFDPGGSMTARPAGYRWNCGILRPACELPPPSLQAPPPPNVPYGMPFPEAPLR